MCRWDRVSHSRRTQSTSRRATAGWTWADGGHSVTSGPPCFVDSQFCSPDDTNWPDGVLRHQSTDAHFLKPRRLFLFLPLALPYRHDWRGECFRWLHTVRMRQLVQTCLRCWSGRLAFISRPLATFILCGWPYLRIRQAMTSSTCLRIQPHLQ